jgi:hypothetical protein
VCTNILIVLGCFGFGGKRAGRVTQGVGFLLCRRLSSNPSTAKRKEIIGYISHILLVLSVFC